jgi:hypothetical protein
LRRIESWWRGSPGAILTPINQELTDGPAQRREVEAEIPWVRVGRPEEGAGGDRVGRLGEAEYVTRTTVFVNGGMTLHPLAPDGEHRPRRRRSRVSEGATARNGPMRLRRRMAPTRCRDWTMAQMRDVDRVGELPEAVMT